MANYKLNFKVPFLDGEGKPIKIDDKETTLSKMLSQQLLSAGSKEPLKLFEWALELIRSGVITVDTTDKGILEDFIKSSDTMTVLTKGRLLTLISGTKPIGKEE